MFQQDLHLCNLRLETLNLLGQCFDGTLQILHLGDKVELLTPLLLCLQLVLVELLCAEILVLDQIIFLLGEL